MSASGNRIDSPGEWARDQHDRVARAQAPIVRAREKYDMGWESDAEMSAAALVGIGETLGVIADALIEIARD